MKNKVLLSVGILSLGLAISGCGNNETQSKDHVSTSSHTEKVASPQAQPKTGKKTATAQVEQPKAQGALANVKMNRVVWSNEKQYALSQFMEKWGQAFDPQQNYTNFYPLINATNSFYGLNYPDGFDRNNTAINNQHVNIGISQDGTTKYDYNVVSVFANGDDGPDVPKFLYLMTIHNGQPLVVYTDQNQGMPDGMVHFMPTKNQQLINEFTRLVKGDDTVTNINLPTVQYAGATLDFRQINMMAYKYANPNDNLVEYLGNNPLASLTKISSNTFSPHTRDTTKAITVSYDSQAVHITWNESGKSQVVPFDKLIAATYTTATQQKEVNQAAQLVILSNL